MNMAEKIDPMSIDTCEGARYSAYITSDLKMLPCSFAVESYKGVDLRKYSIKEAWNSPEFEDFRGKLEGSCHDCRKRELCYGGCPVNKEIVLCKDLKGGVEIENQN